MTGVLKHNSKGWYVQRKNKTYTLHPEESNMYNIYGDYSIDWIGKEVKFKVVSEGKTVYAVTEKFV
jgi:hypothetical protein